MIEGFTTSLLDEEIFKSVQQLFLECADKQHQLMLMRVILYCLCSLKVREPVNAPQNNEEQKIEEERKGHEDDQEDQEEQRSPAN